MNKFLETFPEKEKGVGLDPDYCIVRTSDHYFAKMAIKNLRHQVETLTKAPEPNVINREFTQFLRNRRKAAEEAKEEWSTADRALIALFEKYQDVINDVTDPYFHKSFRQIDVVDGRVDVAFHILLSDSVVFWDCLQEFENERRETKSNV